VAVEARTRDAARDGRLTQFDEAAVEVTLGLRGCGEQGGAEREGRESATGDRFHRRLSGGVVGELDGTPKALCDASGEPSRGVTDEGCGRTMRSGFGLK